MLKNVGSGLLISIIVLGAFLVVKTVFAGTSSTDTQVVVGNADPSVDSVTLNSGNVITLTPNATTTIYVNATISDSNGCADVFTNGSVEILVYRSGVTSSSCSSAQDNINCYKATVFTENDCAAGTSGNATSVADIYYFADATDASSSYAAQNWIATVIATDQSAGTNALDSSGVELNILNAINVATSAIDYGTVSAGSDTGATNEETDVTNAGNSTTTLQVSAVAALTSGSNSIATGSQHYATSSFTFNTDDHALTDSAITVGDFTLTSPTSTEYVSSTLFWGIEIPGGTATGTYAGINGFDALFQN